MVHGEIIHLLCVSKVVMKPMILSIHNSRPFSVTSAAYLCVDHYKFQFECFLFDLFSLLDK